jgi:predicted RecB family nuclease
MRDRKSSNALTSSAQQFTIPKDLLASPIELYFDIEAEPGLDLDYLLGSLGC